LGSTITEDGRSTREIISRINHAKCAFQSKKNMFISRNIDIKVRKNLIKAYVWSVALYGSETWTIGKTEEKRFSAFETWCYRRLLRISWTEHITNEEVYRRVRKTRSFLKTLKTRKAKLIGHILRQNSLLSRIIEGAIEGNNSRERPPLDYISQIVRDMDCRSYCKLKRKAEKRQE
jgi:hypothetical protein